MADEASRGGGTVWFTGLSGSGKSTIAELVAAAALSAGGHPYVLDGDELRHGLNADLGFSPVDRAENVRRMGEVALLFSQAGHLTLVTSISPYARGRRHVRRRHVESSVAFLEVYVATPLEVCERRDPKGLYARARAGAVDFFTGVSDPYEAPESPELVVGAETCDPRESAAAVLSLLCGRRLLTAGGAPHR